MPFLQRGLRPVQDAFDCRIHGMDRGTHFAEEPGLLRASDDTTPILTDQGSPKERGERKEKDKEKLKSEPERALPSIRVTITGILSTTVGDTESTGTELTVEQVRGIPFELDLSKVKDLPETARKLNGKLSVAKGALEVREGRLRKLRFILRTSELKRAAKDDDRDPGYPSPSVSE